MNIKSTYFHVMSISRMQEIENEWGTTKQKLVPVPLLQLLPCAFSQSSRNSKNTTRTESENKVSYNPKMFCDTGLDIKVGDRVSITFANRLLGEFTTGEQYWYSTHQEVPLTMVGEA